jgi:type I restriction enzyme S subunit
MKGRELPVGWTSCYIEDLAGYVTSGSRDWSKYYSSRGALFVRTENINTNRLSPLEEIARVELPASVEGKRTLISKDDLLITITGANVGKCAHIDRVIPEAYVSQSVALVRLLEPSLAGFIHKQLLAPSVDGKYTLLQESAYGIGRPVLSLGDVRQVKIYLAPLNEQHRIAAKLDTTLAAVEACRQRLDGVAAILKRFRQAVLAAATLGELTREWREERGIEVAPTISLREIIKVSSGKFLPAKAMVACGGIPVYGGNGVNGFHNESNISEPTLVIGRVGYYCGSIHLTPEKAWITDNALTVRHDAVSTRAKYLYYALQGIDLRANDSSTAQPVISGSKIYPLRLICPCIEEQDEIVDRVESLFTLANQLEARLTAARKFIERLTPALLAKAFRGELVPQDPNDEPASVLLERIRAARQAEAGAGKPSRRGRRKAAAHPDQLLLDAAPIRPDLLSGLLRECGALSELALLAASELDPGNFRQQLAQDIAHGVVRETDEDGHVLLELVP